MANIKDVYGEFKGMNQEVQAALSPYEAIKREKEMYSNAYIIEAKNKRDFEVKKIMDKYYDKAVNKIDELRLPKDTSKVVDTQQAIFEQLQRLNTNMLFSSKIQKANGKQLVDLIQMHIDNPDIMMMIEDRALEMDIDESSKARNEIYKVKSANVDPLVGELVSLEASLRQVFKKNKFSYPLNMIEGFGNGIVADIDELAGRLV